MIDLKMDEALSDKVIIQEKLNKTPKYILATQKRYYDKKKTEIDYNNMKKENTKAWRAEHREEYNKYMREYRQRKKDEKKQESSF